MNRLFSDHWLTSGIISIYHWVILRIILHFEALIVFTALQCCLKSFIHNTLQTCTDLIIGRWHCSIIFITLNFHKTLIIIELVNLNILVKNLLNPYISYWEHHWQLALSQMCLKKPQSHPFLREVAFVKGKQRTTGPLPLPLILWKSLKK